MIKTIICDIIIWFFIGAILQNIIVIVVYRTGMVDTSRNSDGTLKKKIPFVGILVMSSFLLLLILFIVLFDYFTFHNYQDISYPILSLTNFFLIVLLLLYDSFVIDFLVPGVWKPRFLHIPDDVTLKSMKHHVKKTFTMGLIIIIPLILSCSLIYLLFK